MEVSHFRDVHFRMKMDFSHLRDGIFCGANTPLLCEMAIFQKEITFSEM